MTRLKYLLAVCVVTALAAVPIANAAPTVHFAGSGSSAMYQQFGITVANDIATGVPAFTAGGGLHHFTIKGNCADSTHPNGGACAALNDSRNPVIPNEPATFWLVWVCDNTAPACNGTNATDVWFYSQVDSTVGVRTFLARPIVKTFLAPGVQTGADPKQELINSGLFLFGDTQVASGGCVAGHLTTCDATTVPADVYAAVNGSSLNAGLTDIRPEDALFATERANSTLTGSPWTGLGYGGGPLTLVGAGIVSGFDTSFATPVLFGLPGTNDPFTGIPVPSTITTLSIGESPIVFIVNRTDGNGLGNLPGGLGTVVPFYSSVFDNGASAVGTPSPVGQLFGGTLCSGSSPAFGLGGAVPGGIDFAVNPMLREPLSGTENTTEFSAFRTYGCNLPTIFGSSISHGGSAFIPTTSQEANVGGATLSATPCVSGLGKRWRAVGTGQEVNTAVKNTANAIGYTFFSYGNVAQLKNSASWGYLKFDGVDPIFGSYAGGDPGQPATTAGVVQGTIPGCDVSKNGLGPGNGGCLRGDVWTGGNYFPHLVDGTYRVWSLLRALCDTTDVTCQTDPFGLKSIIAATQDDIHGTGTSPNQAVADFIPFSLDGSFGPAGTIFGDAVYVRSHYAFNSAVGAGIDAGPGSHSTPSFSIAPAGINANLAVGAGGSPEAGGDAGGCIIKAGDSGSVLQVSKATFPAPNVQHIKFTYNLVSGPQPRGICGGGKNNGLYCTISNSGGANPPLGECGSLNFPPDTLNPFGYTCNPVPEGMSIEVTGMTNNKDNGYWQVTKITDLNNIKVKVPTGGGAPVPVALSGQVAAQGSVSAGCSQ